MKHDWKQYTEPIFALLDRYRAALREHPLLVAAQAGQIGRELLVRFACMQYTDSITWIPMLAQMKHKALRSRRLRQAIEDNIGHEAGLGSTSHVQLAVDLLRSLGVTGLTGLPTAALLDNAAYWLSDEFAAISEPALVGWLLTAETLVPELFAAMQPSYLGLADVAYFDEHITVDSDEHATWMAEALAEVVAIYGPACVSDVLAGMAEAWADTLADPDALWKEAADQRAA